MTQETKVRSANTSSTKAAVYVAVFAALIAAMGLVPPITIGILPVPITLQTLGVMLAGAMLGPLRGMLASLVVTVLAIAGLPILAGGRGGISVLLGPTGGYLVAWALASLVIGALFKYWVLRISSPGLRLTAAILSNILGGILVIYAVGVPWTAAVTGLSVATSAWGALVFLPGDLLKAVIAALVALTVHRNYKGLIS